MANCTLGCFSAAVSTASAQFTPTPQQPACTSCSIASCSVSAASSPASTIIVWQSILPSSHCSPSQALWLKDPSSIPDRLMTIPTTGQCSSPGITGTSSSCAVTPSASGSILSAGAVGRTAAVGSSVSVCCTGCAPQAQSTPASTRIDAYVFLFMIFLPFLSFGIHLSASILPKKMQIRKSYLHFPYGR